MRVFSDMRDNPAPREGVVVCPALRAFQGFLSAERRGFGAGGGAYGFPDLGDLRDDSFSLLF